MKKNFVKIEPNPLSLIISKDNVNKNNYNISIQNLTEKYLIFLYPSKIIFYYL